MIKELSLSLAHTLSHSPTLSLSHSLTLSLSHSLILALPHTLAISLSLTHTHSLSRTLSHTLTLTPNPKPDRSRAKRGQLTSFAGHLPETQGQTLALTLLHVPCLMDSGWHLALSAIPVSQ